MALQAQHMGLAAHAMWGFHHDKASEVLKLPDYFTTQAMIAFGHPASAESLPDPLRDLPAAPVHLVQMLAQFNATHPGLLTGAAQSSPEHGQMLQSWAGSAGVPLQI